MILKFFNMLFRIFLIFLMCFVWMRYFINELWLSLLYTALLTISIEFIIHFVFMRKNAKKILHSKEEVLAEKISTTFIFSKTQALNYFYDLAKINFIVKKTSDFIILINKKNEDIDFKDEQQNNQTLILNKENENKEIPQKTIIYPYYSYNLISPQNLVDIVNKSEKYNCEKIIVCGYKIDKNTYKLAEKIRDKKIILLDSFDVYLKIIKQYNLYPSKLMEIKSIEKPSFKELFKASFSRKNSKSFLISSLILLFSSFIVRLNIYYVVISSLLLLFALLSFFLPQKPKINEDKIL